MLWPLVVLGVDDRLNADVKKSHPPHPEEGGLRLEVSALLDDSIGSDGKEARWNGASLNIEIAVQNISKNPVTVPTTAFDGKVEQRDWPNSDPGMEQIWLSIDPPQFKGKPAAFASSRFAPVVLAPGEHALLWHQFALISDRKHADSIKEVSAYFSVSGDFRGQKEWWKGRLSTYAEILRSTDPDKEIAQMNAGLDRYRAETEAEKDPNHGQIVAARAAALIASADRVGIRGENEKEAADVVVRDSKWIQRVSEVIATIPLSGRGACLCSGWRTAYFYMADRLVISVAAIHGNQVRIYWPEDGGNWGGGDFRMSEERWKALSAALNVPKASVQSPNSSPSAPQ